MRLIGTAKAPTPDDLPQLLRAFQPHRHRIWIGSFIRVMIDPELSSLGQRCASGQNLQRFECVQPVPVLYVCCLFSVDGDPILELRSHGFGFLARGCEPPDSLSVLFSG